MPPQLQPKKVGQKWGFCSLLWYDLGDSNFKNIPSPKDPPKISKNMTLSFMAQKKQLQISPNFHHLPLLCYVFLRSIVGQETVPSFPSGIAEKMGFKNPFTASVFRVATRKFPQRLWEWCDSENFQILRRGKSGHNELILWSMVVCERLVNLISQKSTVCIISMWHSQTPRKRPAVFWSS